MPGKRKIIKSGLDAGVKVIGAGFIKGELRDVHGMKDSIDDVVMRGKTMRVKMGDAVLDAGLSRTIEGASQVSLTVHDPEKKILRLPETNTKETIRLGNMKFRLVSVSKTGPDLDMVFEDWAIAKLREKTGPVKAFRDQVTRAEFILSLIREVLGEGQSVRIPELHEIQPIADSKELKEAARERTKSGEDQTQGVRGLGPGANITVKGAKPDAEQIRNANVILDVAMSLKANFRVMCMAIACATQENNLWNNNPGDAAGPDSRGMFGQRLQYYPKAEDRVQATKYLLVSSISEPGGLIGFEKRNPDMNFSLTIAAVQKPAAQYVMEYQQWKEEAANTVREYLGGASAGSGGDESVEVTTPKRYAFEVKKNESYWKAITRLAEEVRWRAFFVGNTFFFIDEMDLYGGVVRARIDEDSPGVDSIDFEYHGNKPVTEVTVTGRAKLWTAPPGTVVQIVDMGPASNESVETEASIALKEKKQAANRRKRARQRKLKKKGLRQEIGTSISNSSNKRKRRKKKPKPVGRYIVTQIDSSLLSSEAVTITLKKPMKPLPEPAPEMKTKSVKVGSGEDGGGATGEGAQKMVKWAKKQIGVAEGSAKHAAYCRAAGISTSTAWCSAFIAYGLVQICGLSSPASPAYSGTWMEGWSDGKRVSGNKPQPGDLVIYDWGDGGITDHITLYIGNGQEIGGNTSAPGGAVRQSTVTSSAVVGWVRPNYA